MSKHFVIYEEDLADLERIMPQLAVYLGDHPNGNRVRTQLRQVQRILSDVRWGYGPPKVVDHIEREDA